jgi:hypothetical protein
MRCRLAVAVLVAYVTTDVVAQTTTSSDESLQTKVSRLERELNELKLQVAQLRSQVTTLLPTPTAPVRQVSITDLPVLEGRITRKADSTVFGEKYRDAFFLSEETIAVRTAKSYARLVMSVGIQDNAEARGSKHFWVRDERDEILFEGHARAGYAPVSVDIDISGADRISFSSVDYNGEPRDFVRWLNINFVRK